MATPSMAAPVPALLVPPTFDGSPPGVAIDFDVYQVGPGWPGTDQRPRIVPRVAVVHTNDATREGSLQSQINWANTPTGSGMLWNTHAHYMVNQGHESGAAALKALPSDRRGIGNSTGSSLEPENQTDPSNRRDSSYFSLVIESRDRGDGGESGFIGNDAELVARILAYESIAGGFPLELPAVWWGEGCATHTWPFDYPAYTTRPGKTCPGSGKKSEFAEWVLPRARIIRQAWDTPVPPPKDTIMDPFRFRHVDYADQFSCDAGGAMHMTPARAAGEYAGLPLVEDDDLEWLIHCCNAARFDFGRLTPFP